MRSLELFAGIGGIALAEQMAGIEVAGLCEYADYPRMILQKHWPDVPLFKDVTKLDREELTNAGINHDSIDLVSGGFPCQPFSNVATSGENVLANSDGNRWEKSKPVFKQKFSKRKSEREPSTTSSTPAKWQPEPSVGRVADGVPNRMDRIKALGNAVVPQQILPIFKAIVQIEEANQ